MKHFLLSTAVVALAFPVLAQNTNQATNDKLERLERDIQLLQKQLANEPQVSEGGGTINVSNARLGAQLSQIQEDLRKIHGQLEQQDNSNRRTAEALERLQKDTDLRLSDVEKKLTIPAVVPPTTSAPVAPEAPPAATSPTAQPTQAAASAEPPKEVAKEPAKEPPKPVIKVEDAPAAATETPEPAKEKPKGFATARDHYNFAFRLLNQTKYDEAAASFQSFTKAFPKDPLIGNAYYWLGETHYIKRDFVKASDNFRQGFEALPGGPKAPDNLLKLAMSLSALKRNDDACVVLSQLTTKFKGSSSVLLKKAEDEKGRMECP